MVAASHGIVDALPPPLAGGAEIQAPVVVPETPTKGLRRRWPIALVALALLVAAGAVAYFVARRPAAPAFRTTPAVVTDITQQVTATGTLQPVITSPVGAQVSGIVYKLYADYNSEVKAGDLLVELDPALFKNAVSLATAQLLQMEANRTGAEATALGARAARDRTARLLQDSLAAKTDMDSTEAIFGQARGASQSSSAQIAAARAQLDLARLNLQHSIIRAPVNGTVISRSVDVGQAVAATLTAPTLFTIAQDMRHMQVHAAVDEADIGGVHQGQAATFTVDAFRDQSFGAVVNQVRNAPQTLSNVVTYDVVLDVENPALTLRPGMTANVLILVVKKTNVIAVPNEALRFRPAQPSAPTPGATPMAKAPASDAKPSAAVYVPGAVGATRVPIKTGITDGNMTEVLGLEPGRAVIVDVARKSAGAAGGGAGRGP